MSKQISRHNYLDSLNLVVNNRLMCLCCEMCEVALTPSQVQGHLNSAHAEFKMCIDKHHFEEVIELYDIQEDLPSLSHDIVVEAWEGLKVHQGFRCLHCSKVLGLKDSMLKHHKQLHKEHLTPSAWPAICMQRLSSRPGEASTFFEVIPRNSTPKTSIEAFVEQVRKEMASVLEVRQIPRNARSVSPWLLTTRWHEHFEGFDTLRLLKLIAVPKETEFPGLKALVLKYMKKATNLIKCTQELPLQRLNSPDPIKE